MKKNEQRTYTQRKEDDLCSEGRLSSEEREGKERALAQNTKGRRNQIKRWKYLKRNSASAFLLSALLLTVVVSLCNNDCERKNNSYVSRRSSRAKVAKICATYFKNSCGTTTTTTTITTRVAIRDCSLSCATCHALSSCTCWAKNKYNNKGNITQEVEAWGNCYKSENGKLKRQVRGDFRCGRRRRSLSRRRRMSHSRVCHNGKWYVLLYNSNENKLTVTCYTPTVTHIHAMIMCTHG